MSPALELSTENASKITEMVAANMNYGNSIKRALYLSLLNIFFKLVSKNLKMMLGI